MHHLSDVKFISLDISENSKRALTQDLKYEFLTHIQNETFSHVLQGEDVLAKAKTGNGKTVAFLLPLVERFLNSFKSHVDRIPILILSPTRELALQITAEARKLTKYHHLHTACFVGGTSINRDIRTISSKDLPIDLLIATPGRLQDHLEKDSGNITSKLGACEILVLDEADRLLDMGFRPVILKIIEYLPKKRQTLLFSATLPASTQELTKIALREDYRFVDTIDEDDHQTNKQTEQHFVLCKMEEIIPATETLLLEHLKRPEYKVMVFFPTARTAGYMATLFLKAGFNVLEMHSRKSQSHRTKTAEIFRKSNKVIMFSSDVSARGVDYPDISLVLQVGLTDRDQYIHRLGRTARAGMEGQGILLLAEFEKPLLKELSDLPIQEMSLPISLNGSKTAKVLLATSRNQELMRVAEMSYQAWLGFYNTHLKRLGLDKVHLVQMAAEYSKSIGLIEVPRIQKKTLKKMNLFGVPGIRVDHS
jgi:ATP-dependent RNA helicase MSS116